MEKITKPRYPKMGNEGIFLKLRQDVNKLVQDPAKDYRSAIVFKAILFPISYITAYLAALSWGNVHFVLYSCYFLLSSLMEIIFMNIIHDALLKAYSQKDHLPYREFILWTSLKNHYKLFKHHA